MSGPGLATSLRSPVDALAVLESVLDLRVRPTFTHRPHANARAILAVDETERGNVVIDLKKLQVRRRQPSQCEVEVTGIYLPD